MSNYLPAKDLDLQHWVNNFVNVANANESALGISDSDIAAITGEDNFFMQALAALQAAKTAHEGAVKSKDDVRKVLDFRIRALVKRLQSNSSIPPALKSQLGINDNTGTRTKTPPATPLKVAANPQATGVNTIAWSKMGNKPTTQYVVYAKPLTPGAALDTETGWTIVGQTTRSRFHHLNVTPGQPFAYKVVAARAAQASLPSAPVTVYGA